MFPEITAALAETPDPERARASLERIKVAWPSTDTSLAEVLASFGHALPGLLHLLSVSPISTTKIIRDPAALAWLAASQIREADRGMVRMRVALRDLGWKQPAQCGVPVRPDTFSVLRKWKQRETLRIALRDVVGCAQLEETTQELTCLAEVCMQEVSDAWIADHTRRLGDPGTASAVLGMGKFGGEELNFSSDIDVIFFYGEPGELASGLTRQEFFTRVAQKVIETFTAAHPAGALFRIDLRLRPEGDAGLLTRSLDSMEHYYAAFGETWERMALSKGRLVAGDAELGYEFFQRLQSFIYPRSVSPDMIEEVALMKGRIERELLSASRIHRDVKLGRGGIREVEFVCQSLQLLHGARHVFLQERQTLRAISGLRRLGLIGIEEANTLAVAYRFLRSVEHRLQIENEAQTHTIPENGDALRRLAHSLSACRSIPAAEAVDEFLVALIRNMDAVREIFDRVMQAQAEPTPTPVDLSFFRDSGAAEQTLADLGGAGGRASIAPRTRKVFARLEPLLLGWMRELADPDAALTRLARFTERYGQRGAFFETLLVNPRVLELFVKLFDASPFLSEIAIQRPQLVEEVARLGNLDTDVSCTEHLAALGRNDEQLPWSAWVRVYRRAQQLRIGLRDLLGFAQLTEVWSECSALAEACLVFTARQLGCVEDLTIVALGKFGGFELGYGADLDVLFIGADVARAATLIRAMTEVTSEGRVFPVDARLRPEGESGLMAVTLQAWTDYFARGRGELWEAQALTKARPIAGPEQTAWLETAQRIWREHGQRADLRKRIQAMLQKIAEHRGSDPVLDFKTGPGGVMQLEFFTQSNQMQAAFWEPNTLKALTEVAPSAALQPLTEAYIFLRRIETVLRRQQDNAVSRIPSDPVEQAKLATRCGFSSRDAFLEATQQARVTIARLARL